MDKPRPYIVAFAGKAGSGKTVMADALAPPAQGGPLTLDTYRWNRVPFALPIHQIVSIKRQISGENADSRIKFNIHETLYDLFGTSIGDIPPYDQFCELVSYIGDLPLGSDNKPRKFMQTVGTVCREYFEDCFAQWMIRRVKLLWAQSPEPLAIAVDDMRFPNEATILKEHDAVLIRLDCNDEVRAERLYRRDGERLDLSAPAHESEHLKIPEDCFDHIIDTTDLSVAQQWSIVSDLVDHINPSRKNTKLKDITNALISS